MSMRVDPTGLRPAPRAKPAGSPPRDSRMLIDRWALGALFLLASCGDDGVVGFPDNLEPCWPIMSSPGGSVEMGTGQITWMPMPDTVIVNKNPTQSDPYLEVHSRIRGMPPGSPDDPFDPKNPRTKVGLAVDELGLVLGVDCPASLGYVAASESGVYDLVHSLRVGFGSYPVDQAIGKQARITVEVVGSNRLYARDEKVVMLVAPPP
jgi:hypothetical protein